MVTQDEEQLDANTFDNMEDGNLKDEILFTEYVAPPADPIRPPPKYKAWIVIIVLVYCSLWATSLAGLIPWLQDTFLLSVSSSIFVQLCLIVFVLSYAAVDVLVFLCRIKINSQGVHYGMGRWLGNASRVQWVHEYRNVPVEILGIVITILEDGFSMFNAPPLPTPTEKDKQQFEETDNNNNSHRQVVLRIENKVRIDMYDKYNSWKREVKRVMKVDSRPGLLHADCENLVEKREDHMFCRVQLAFESIDHLNEYMKSPVRSRLIRKLQPLLLEEPRVVMQAKTVDAFSDLCGRQGLNAPQLPPLKWKVWWITVLALYTTVSFLNQTTPFYFEQWSLDDEHPRVQSLVVVFMTTFLSSYVTTPLVTLLFGHWLHRNDNAGVIIPHEPWRTLNDGFQSILMKMGVVLTFFGGCVIAWALRSFS